MTTTTEQPNELLERRIKESGLTTVEFAEEVLKRDGRLVRRWLEGKVTIPQIVVEFLEDPWVCPWPDPDDEDDDV